jgi:predicted O-methyltransferase YrrM
VDERLTALLDELHRAGVEHDEGKADRVERLRNVEPDSARVLALLVRATPARRVLELGTSNGYSTMWLADAVGGRGGRLLSVDVDAERSAEAARNLDRGGVREWVELRVEDAATTLRTSPESFWDMIFLDGERSAYAGYWPDLLRVLRPGGLLAVDNVLSHAEEVRALPGSRECRGACQRSARANGGRPASRGPRAARGGDEPVKTLSCASSKGDDGSIAIATRGELATATGRRQVASQQRALPPGGPGSGAVHRLPAADC